MKKNISLLLALTLASFLYSCDDNISDSSQNLRDEYTSVEQLLEDIDFSGTILVRKEEEDIVRSGFGFSDASENMKNGIHHIFRIGSMTKSFTAMGLVHLKRDGLIQSYDQPISDFVEDFPRGEDITLRHLLTHYTGIRDYTFPVEQYIESQNVYITPDEIMEIVTESIAEDGLIFEPGAQFAYSNSNYLLLGLLIEALTDMSYHEYLKIKIIDPLDLSSTEEGPDVMSGALYAKGYHNGAEVAPYSMQIAYSAGDLISTISDMEKWGDAILGDEYLTAEEKSEIFAEPASEDGFYTPGLGWYTIRVEGTLMHYHGGDIAGYSSLIALLPESQSLIIILGNDEDGGIKRNTIQDMMAKYEF